MAIVPKEKAAAKGSTRLQLTPNPPLSLVAAVVVAAAAAVSQVSFRIPTSLLVGTDLNLGERWG